MVSAPQIAQPRNLFPERPTLKKLARKLGLGLHCIIIQPTATLPAPFSKSLGIDRDFFAHTPQEEERCIHSSSAASAPSK